MKRLFFGVFGGFCLVLMAIGAVNYSQFSAIQKMQEEIVRTDNLIRAIAKHKEEFLTLRQHNVGYDQTAFNQQLAMSRNERFWYKVEHKRLLLNESLYKKGYQQLTTGLPDRHMEQLRNKETQLLRQIAELGFKELGIIGLMRERAHFIEQNYPQYRTQLLSLRRHEKDFLMRVDRNYAHLFQKEYREWKKTEHYPKELTEYAQLFQQVVRAYLQLLKSSFPSWIRKYDGLQAELYAQQSGIITTGVKETTTANRSILVLNGSMILLAVFISFLFIEWFNRQLKSLQESMTEYIAKNYVFSEEIQLRFPKNDLGKIALNFLKLTRKIRSDMQLLEERVNLRTDSLQRKNNLLESQHREIMDGMRYAQNLQQSMLVSRNKLLRSFKEAWVFYQPKDLVGGDFYWMKEIKKPEGNLILFALADCTGHGVPGALLSVMGMNALDELIESGVTEPSLLLTQLRTIILRRLNTHEDKRYDGMDIVLFAWNPAQNILSFSGAQLPVWILRNNEVHIFKGQRVPVGYSYTPVTPFTESQIELVPGDRILLFSDGFVDQFGSFSGKKMGKKHLHNWLKEHMTDSTLSLHYKLLDLYQNWKGNSEQTDDCTYILLEPEITGNSHSTMFDEPGTNAVSNLKEKAEVSIGVANKCG